MAAQLSCRLALAAPPRGGDCGSAVSRQLPHCIVCGRFLRSKLLPGVKLRSSVQRNANAKWLKTLALSMVRKSMKTRVKNRVV
jgi:hypothetical protein